MNTNNNQVVYEHYIHDQCLNLLSIWFETSNMFEFAEYPQLSWFCPPPDPTSQRSSSSSHGMKPPLYHYCYILSLNCYIVTSLKLRPISWPRLEVSLCFIPSPKTKQFLSIQGFLFIDIETALFVKMFFGCYSLVFSLSQSKRVEKL